jgi:hypothetical protein
MVRAFGALNPAITAVAPNFSGRNPSNLAEFKELLRDFAVEFSEQTESPAWQSTCV